TAWICFRCSLALHHSFRRASMAPAIASSDKCTKRSNGKEGVYPRKKRTKRICRDKEVFLSENGLCRLPGSQDRSAAHGQRTQSVYQRTCGCAQDPSWQQAHLSPLALTPRLAGPRAL